MHILNIDMIFAHHVANASSSGAIDSQSFSEVQDPKKKAFCPLRTGTMTVHSVLRKEHCFLFRFFHFSQYVSSASRMMILLHATQR